ncbi:nesprin-1-like, partial [Limulus polyphemus]|uniref:Nesprin-1-like n=1 Tax=Limulus polyphemus TaxID=6850 RepID=A0ABM1BLM8_LIMPO
CEQISNWLKEVADKLGSETDLKPDLVEKETQLQNYKSVVQDIVSHQPIILKLEEKAKTLPEMSALQNISDLQTKYDELLKSGQSHTEACQIYVDGHLAYNQKLEKFQDWLKTIKATVDQPGEHGGVEILKSKLEAISGVLAEQNIGSQKLNELGETKEKILCQTHSSGHENINKELNSLHDQWQNFLSRCEAVRENVSSRVDKWNQSNDTLLQLEEWQAAKESQLRDQPLRNSTETKMQQLNRIKDLEAEIISKEEEFTLATSQVQQISGETTLGPRLAKVNSRYQMLKNLVKEATGKWEQFVQEHQGFDKKLEDLQASLDEPETEMTKLTLLTGDITMLQTRKTELEALIEQLSQHSSQIENISEAGERLYPHTSPDGREEIRQQIRSVRDKWDSLNEQASLALRKLDSCQQQIKSFHQGQEQLIRWLQDVELAIEQHTEAKGTLQEKRAQLQNHKVVYQDIVSHKAAVDTVCDKSEQLTSLTQDDSLHGQVQNLKDKYQTMSTKSQDLLTWLDKCVSEHQQYLDLCKAFQDFLLGHQQKLQECRDTAGEKRTIQSRLTTLRELRTQEKEGDSKMQSLCDQCHEVCMHTSEYGADVLRREVQEMRDSWSQHTTSTLEAEHNLENVLQQWMGYEENLQFMLAWLKELESAVKHPQLQSSVEEKEEQLKTVQELRDKVLNHQKTVDSLTDEGHALLQVSGVEHIRGQISQCSFRYQSLLSNVKALIIRWENMVEDHKNYKKMTSEFEAWLTGAENVVSELKKEGKIENKMDKLQVLMNDKSKGQQLLNQVVQAGERLYQDTSANGRDAVRQELRKLHDCWDQLDVELTEQQRLLQNRSQQWHVFMDNLKQIVNWLNATEKSVELDKNNHPGVQDIPTRLQKYKLLQQDIVIHKRQLDSLQEKLQSSTTSLDDLEVKRALSEATERIEALCEAVKVELLRVENLGLLAQKYRDLREHYSQWYQQTLDKLLLCKDYTGNRATIQARLEKLQNIEKQLPEGTGNVNSLGEYTKELRELVCPKDRDTMEQEHMVLVSNQQRLTTETDEASHQLQDRLQQWTTYEDQFSYLLERLELLEAQVQDFSLKTTLEEKKEQLSRYQALIDDIEAEQRTWPSLSSLAVILDQALLSEMKDKEREVDSLSDSTQELIEASGEMRLSMGVSQITSRYQSLLLTCKELVRKCEQHVEDHISFQEKHDECSKWIMEAQDKYAEVTALPSGNRAALQVKYGKNKELIQMKNTGLNLVNSTVQLGEQLQVGTSPEGWETTQTMLQNLQTVFDTIFDGSIKLDRSLQSTMFLWSEYEDEVQALQQWIRNTSQQLEGTLKLVTSLSEKKRQLQTYRGLQLDINSHQQSVEDLQIKAEALPDRDEGVDEILNSIITSHSQLKEKAQICTSKYEDIVAKHEQLSKMIGEVETWLQNTQSLISSCGETSLDRISLQSSLDRLKGIQAAFEEEEPKLKAAEEQLDLVLVDTLESGSGELDSLKEQWKTTQDMCKTTTEFLLGLLGQWKDYEERLDEVQSWIRDTESSLSTIPLCVTLSEKREQLEKLKGKQGEIRAKELEVDALTDKIQQLHKGSSARRVSQLSELGIRYQQLISLVKNLVSKWTQYVSNHQRFENELADCQSRVTEAQSRLQLCEGTEGTVDELETKLAMLQELINNKEELVGKIQSVAELAQIVLTETLPVGHQPINDVIQTLQENRSNLLTKLMATKSTLEDALYLWSSFLVMIKQASKVVSQMENTLMEGQQLQATLSEKKAQLDKIKIPALVLGFTNPSLDIGFTDPSLGTWIYRSSQSCHWIYRSQPWHLDLQIPALVLGFTDPSLGTWIYRSQPLSDPDQGKYLMMWHKIIEKLHIFVAKHPKSFISLSMPIIEAQVLQNDQNYKDHSAFKNSCDDLVSWMKRLREKIPPMTRSVSDRLSLETSVSTLEELLTKKAQGKLKVDNMDHCGEVAKVASSEAGQNLISTEITALKDDFDSLFSEIEQMKEKLESICVQLREFKDEYEKVSEWLQLMEADIKTQKVTLKSSLEEKEGMVKYSKGLLEELEKGKESVDKLTLSAQGLLTSHLDTYIRNQLSILNSRYQVIFNLCKDVHSKVEQQLDQHKHYKDKVDESRLWIKKMTALLEECGIPTGSREAVEIQLAKIKEVTRKQEEGQALVHGALSAGEKTIHTTHPTGKNAITLEMHDLQSAWDCLVLKVSEAKVSLESALLQWADYSSAEARLSQWISDHDQKLQQVKTMKVGTSGRDSVSQRRARLRKANSLVQDIESFEPMIESVNAKAEELQQQSGAGEIADKYHSLVQQAREYMGEQKTQMDIYQQFVDACSEFGRWLNTAKEKLSKCAQPSGDKEVLKGKTSKIKVLQAEQDEGLQKLNHALELSEQTKQQLEEQAEKDVIDMDVKRIEEEYKQFKANVDEMKSSIDVGMVKWNEYEEQFKKCSKWVEETEPLLQSFLTLQADLIKKRARLEEFQGHLQTIFDWQAEFDKLNVRAQLLLETYSDSSISNAFTQLSSKYSNLLSLSKEVMHKLEQHFQEHQQQQCMLTECVEFIDVARERLKDCCRTSHSVDELNAKLNSLKSLASNMEQGQNKVRYVLELTEKVIVNTDSSGISSIQEDAENLKTDFDKLVKDISDARVHLASRMAELDEFTKILKQFQEYLEETENTVNADSRHELVSVTEKKYLLDNYRAILKDMDIRRETIDRLNQGMEQNPQVADVAKNSIEKFQNLMETLQKAVSVLTVEIKDLEAYSSTKQETEKWLKEVKLKAQKCGECVGDHSTIQQQQEELLKVKESLPNGEELVEKVSSLGNNVKEKLELAGQERIEQEIEQITIEWECLQALVGEVEQNITKCLQYWGEFQAVYCHSAEWLSRFQNMTKSVLAVPPGSGKEQEQLNELKALHEEACFHKPDIEEVNQKCEALLDVTSYPTIREKAVSLSTSYSSLLTSITDTIPKLEKALSYQSEFSNLKEKYLRWIQESRATLQKNKDPTQDQDCLQERIQSLKNLATSLPEGQHLLATTCEAGTRILGSLPDTAQSALRADIDSYRDQLATLSQQLSEATALLSSVLARLQEFNQNSANFRQWLEDLEGKLSSPPKTKGEIVEIRTLFEQYKHLRLEIEQQQPQLSELQAEAQELAEKTDDPQAVDLLTEMTDRLTASLNRCLEILSQLESELQTLQDYQHALQETEKWLLQMSFNLMSHHSLQISSLPQTQDHLEKHKRVLEEIERYQTVIDKVKAKGGVIIETYKERTIENQINKQLANIQESYDSLLASAEQIEARLDQAFQKFRTYEETLNQCDKLLAELEPELAQENETTPQTLEVARENLDNSKTALSQLVMARQQLQTAIQGCVEATTSLSRPSSPEDAIVSPLPERETQIKIRLQDFIEQAESRIVAINNIVHEWEAVTQLKETVEHWVADQKVTVSTLESGLVVMEPEVLQHQLNDLENMKQELEEKLSAVQKIEQKEQSTLPNTAHTVLKEKLKCLEDQVAQLMMKTDARKAAIKQFKDLIEEVEGRLEFISTSLESAEKPESGDSLQRQELLKQLTEEIERAKGQMAELNTSLSEICNFLEEEERIKQKEHLKTLEKKANDLHKRVLRRLESLDLLRANYGSVLEELSKLQEWVEEKLEKLHHLSPPGFHTESLEKKLQEAHSLRRETVNKEVVIETSEKRVETLIPELDNRDAENVKKILKELKQKFSELNSAVQSHIDKLNDVIVKSQELELVIEQAKQWLREKEQELSHIEVAGGRSSETDKTIDLIKKTQVELQSFEETEVRKVVRHKEQLHEACSEDDQADLQSLVDEITMKLEELKRILEEKINFAKELFAELQQYERLRENINHWLNLTESSLASDVRTDVAEDGLEEQITTHTKLEEESRVLVDDLHNLQKAAESIIGKVKEAEKLFIEGELQRLEEHRKRLEELIKERLEALQDALQVHHEQVTHVEETTEMLEELQTKLCTLNQPMGVSVEDSRVLLETCEEVLKKLQEVEEKIDQLKPHTQLTEELQKLLSQYQDAVRAAENQHARIKQSVAQREQYHSSVREITDIISQCTKTITVVEETQADSTDKLRKYQNLLDQIVECEAKLTATQDKGEKIGSEGSVSDRNSIMDELQKLKAQLNNLRKTVQKMKSDHENMMAEQKKLVDDLEDILEQLRKDDVAVKTRPLLALHLPAVEEEITRHGELSDDVHLHLKSAEQLKTSIVEELTSDTMPEFLQENISEVSLLQNTLPRELQERESWLKSALNQLKEFHEAKDKLCCWLHSGDKLLQSAENGVDFENIKKKLEEVKKFFSEISHWEIQKDTLNSLSLKIQPFLKKDQVEHMTQDLRSVSQQLDDLQTRADKAIDALEKDAQDWLEYNQLLDKVNSLLTSLQIVDEKPVTMAAIRTSLQSISSLLSNLQSNQELISDVNVKARGLDHRASPSSRKLIDKQVAGINQKWQNILCQLEGQLSTLTDVLNQWEIYAEVYYRAETAVLKLEHNLNAIEVVPEAEDTAQ